MPLRGEDGVELKTGRVRRTGDIGGVNAAVAPPLFDNAADRAAGSAIVAAGVSGVDEEASGFLTSTGGLGIADSADFDRRYNLPSFVLRMP